LVLGTRKMSSTRMTDTNNPNINNNEGALTRARSARLGVTPMAHATEEQQPPVQVVTHPAQDEVVAVKIRPE
jgi:hypothetical protein